MANLHDNLKTNMAAIVNKGYCWQDYFYKHWFEAGVHNINDLLRRAVPS